MFEKFARFESVKNKLTCVICEIRNIQVPQYIQKFIIPEIFQQELSHLRSLILAGFEARMSP